MTDSASVKREEHESIDVLRLDGAVLSWAFIATSIIATCIFAAMVCKHHMR